MLSTAIMAAVLCGLVTFTEEKRFYCISQGTGNPVIAIQTAVVRVQETSRVIGCEEMLYCDSNHKLLDGVRFVRNHLTNKDV